jgi:WD40 repeat protein
MYSKFNAFISYSRKDIAFASALERALEAYIPPRVNGEGKKRIEVFRDEGDFTGSEYYNAIQQHLQHSEKLIVICSPAARSSAFVNDEINRFAALHGKERIIPVLLSGQPNNIIEDGKEGERAFPQALCELLKMPLAVNYVEFQIGRDPINKGAFYNSWYFLLANLLDTSRDIIEERDRKRHIRTLKTWIGITSGIVIILACLAIWALIERKIAVRNEQITRAERLIDRAKLSGSLEPSAIERRALINVEAIKKLIVHDQPLYDATATLREVLSLLPRRILSLDSEQSKFIFSGDGLHAFSNDARFIQVYNLITGRQVVTLKAGQPLQSLFSCEEGSVGALDISGTVTIWKAPDWRSVSNLKPLSYGRVLSAAMDQEGKHVVVLSGGRTGAKVAHLQLWQIEPQTLIEEKLIHCKGDTIGIPSFGECISFNGDHILIRLNTAVEGRRLIAGLWKWRVRNLLFDSKLPGDTTSLLQWDNLIDAAWSSDTESLIIARNTEPSVDQKDKRVTFINLRYGGEQPGAQVKSISQLAERGHILISGQAKEDPYVPLLNYSTIDAYDSRTGKELGSVAEQGSDIWLNPSGSKIITSNGSRVRVWKTSGGQELFRIPVRSSITKVQFSLSERYLATINEKGAVEVWDLANPGITFSLQMGKKLVGLSKSGQFVALEAPGYFIVIDLKRGKQIASVLINNSIKEVKFSPNEKFVAVLSDSVLSFQPQPKKIVLLSLSANTSTLVYNGQATAASFTPSGDSLMIGGSDGSLRLIRSANRQVIWKKKIGRSPVMRCGFSANGRVGGVAMSDSIVVIIPSTGKEIMRVNGTSGFAFDSIGSQMAYYTSASAEVIIVQVPSGSVKYRFKHPKQLDEIKQVAFLPEGTKLLTIVGNRASTFLGASFFTEQTLFLWDIMRKQLLRRLPEGSNQDKEYKETLSEEEKLYFSDVVATNNGQYVVAQVYPSRLNYWAVPQEFSTSELRMWRLDGVYPLEVFRLQLRNEYVNKLGIAEGATTLFTQGDNTQLWSLSAEDLIQEVCRRVSRNLTQEEWLEFFGENEPYHKTCPNLP